MSNAEIHARIDALVEEDRLEEALKLADELVPVSKEEFDRILAAAPIDDEPVSPADRAAIDHGRRIAAALSTRDAEARRAG